MRVAKTMAVLVSAGLTLTVSSCSNDVASEPHGAATTTSQVSVAPDDTSATASTPTDTQSSSPADTQASSSNNQRAEEATVFQFDEARIANPSNMTPVVAESGKLIVKPSPEMIATLPEGAKQVVDSYEITGKTFPTGICRTDVKVNYAPGAAELPSKMMENRSPGRPEDSARNAITQTLLGLGVRDVTTGPIADDELQSGSQFMSEDWQNFTYAGNCEGGQDNPRLTLNLPMSTPEYPLQQAADPAVQIATATVLIHRGNAEGTVMPSITQVTTPLRVSATGEWKAPGGWTPSY